MTAGIRLAQAAYLIYALMMVSGTWPSAGVEIEIQHMFIRECHYVTFAKPSDGRCKDMFVICFPDQT